MKFYKFFIILVFVTGCFPAVRSSRTFHHLVIDAGSTGTRFCLYEIRKNTTCSLQTKEESCFSSSIQGGLANVKEEMIPVILQDGISQIRKQRIDYISLYGTGGFRKLSSGEQQEKFLLLNRYLEKTEIPYTLAFLSGEEEAYFAWKSVQIRFRSRDHSILETGGATVQIGMKRKKDFVSVSIPLGVNEVSGILERDPGSRDCVAEKLSSIEKYEFCKNRIKNLIYSHKPLQDFLSIHKDQLRNRTVYVMGKPWKILFEIMHKKEIHKSELTETGRNICVEGKNIAIAVSGNYKERLCFLFLYQDAMLETTGIEEVRKGAESWTAGAAMSHPECGGQDGYN